MMTMMQLFLSDGWKFLQNHNFKILESINIRNDNEPLWATNIIYAYRQ